MDSVAESSPPTTDGGKTPTVLLQKNGFELGPPSAYPNPETDKLDLDTGERGYGKIVEETDLHAFSDGDRVLVRLDAAEQGTYESCARALAVTARRMSRIPLRELGPDSRLCVSTDQGRVALVTIRSILHGPILLIDYITWEAA